MSMTFQAQQELSLQQTVAFYQNIYLKEIAMGLELHSLYKTTEQPRLHLQ